jgi:hypothetical protein
MRQAHFCFFYDYFIMFVPLRGYSAVLNFMQMYGYGVGNMVDH